MLPIHVLLLRVLETKDLLEFGLKLDSPTLLLLRHRVSITRVKIFTFLSFSPSITTCSYCPIFGLIMLLDPQFLHRMSNHLNPWESKKVTTKLLRPTNADQLHQIRGKGGPLIVAKTPLKLIPKNIHHIKLQTRSSVLMSENHEINHETMNLINVARLWIEHLPIDMVHDIIDWKQILCVTWRTPS
jgi:hypothetical protein